MSESNLRIMNVAPPGISGIEIIDGVDSPSIARPLPAKLAVNDNSKIVEPADGLLKVPASVVI